MTDVITYDKDADGVVTLTLDDPNARANTMTDDFRASLSDVVDRLEAEQPCPVSRPIVDVLGAQANVTQRLNQHAAPPAFVRCKERTDATI